MTPKEKAKELVDKYFLQIQGADRYAYNLPSMNLFIAKQCALIAVDEMLKEFENIDDGQTEIPYGYWKKVKQEIEKL